MSFAIPESEAVEMVIEHMTGPLKTAVAYGNPTTFVKLFDRVARMERRTKDGTIPLSSSSQPSSKPPSSYQARKKTTKVVKLPTQLPWKKKPKWVPLRSVFLIRSNLDGTYLRRPLVVLRKPMIVEGVTKMLEFLMIMGAERATVPIKGRIILPYPYP